MKCLYLINKNECKILNRKECCKCSFYKEHTKENYNNYIIQVEKDILLYGKRKK